jgi:coatomer subunit beta'
LWVVSQLGELAMTSGDLPLAESCLTKAADLSGLLLMYSSTGNAAGMKELAQTARAAGKHNVSAPSLPLWFGQEVVLLPE